MNRSLRMLTLASMLFPVMGTFAFGASEAELWVHPYVCKDRFFGALRDDYVQVMTDASQWERVLARTDTVGFHMALLDRHRDLETGKISLRTTDDQLRVLAAFYKKHNLKVNIEIGGVRYRPESVKTDRTGVGRRYTRAVQIPLLERWKKAGGSIDYLTIDHAVMMRMGEQAAGKTKDGVVYTLDELVTELAEALAELHGAFPEAEFVNAESLGHFEVTDPDSKRTYKVGRREPNPVALSDFLAKLKTSTEAVGVAVNGFAIDFQIQAAYCDATGKSPTVAGPFNLKPELADRAAGIPVDLGRARAAAEIARAADMRVIFMVTPGAYGFGVKDDPADRNDRRAFEAVCRMAKEYAKAEIEADALVFECWQLHPSRTGPETDENSFLYNVLQNLPPDGEPPHK